MKRQKQNNAGSNNITLNRFQAMELLRHFRSILVLLYASIDKVEAAPDQQTIDREIHFFSCNVCRLYGFASKSVGQTMWDWHDVCPHDKAGAVAKMREKMTEVEYVVAQVEKLVA